MSKGQLCQIYMYVSVYIGVLFQCRSNQAVFLFTTCTSKMVFLNRYIVVSALAIFACMITPTEQQLTVRIYTNLAEIIEPVTKLPLEFSINDWNDILSDSITLLGTNLTVLSQSIIQKTNSINAAQVYIRSPISSCTTSKPLIKATIIDDKTYSVKVKVNDELVAGKVLYFTVQKQDIFYLVEDIDPIVQVDFTYTSSSRRIHANYLRRGLSWQAQYQLNIQGNRSDLFVFANIRNNLNSPLSITQAELVSGDRSIIITNVLYVFRKNRVLHRFTQRDTIHLMEKQRLMKSILSINHL